MHHFQLQLPGCCRSRRSGVTRLKVCVTPSCLRSSPRLDASTGNCFGCFSFVPTERLPCPSRLGEAVESKVYCWRPSGVFWRMRASLSLACAQAATLSTQVVGQPRSRTQVREFLFFWELLRQNVTSQDGSYVFGSYFAVTYCIDHLSSFFFVCSSSEVFAHLICVDSRYFY